MCQPLCEDLATYNWLCQSCAWSCWWGKCTFISPPDIWGCSRWEEFAHPAGDSQQPPRHVSCVPKANSVPGCCSSRAQSAACPSVGPWRGTAGTAKAAVWHREPAVCTELSHSRVCWVTTDTRAFVSSDCGPLTQVGKHLKPNKFRALQTSHLFLHPCHRWGICWLAPIRGAKLQQGFLAVILCKPTTCN